jgi:hypothetical protein
MNHLYFVNKLLIVNAFEVLTKCLDKIIVLFCGLMYYECLLHFLFYFVFILEHNLDNRYYWCKSFSNHVTWHLYRCSCSLRKSVKQITHLSICISRYRKRLFSLSCTQWSLNYFELLIIIFFVHLLGFYCLIYTWDKQTIRVR